MQRMNRTPKSIHLFDNPINGWLDGFIIIFLNHYFFKSLFLNHYNGSPINFRFDNLGFQWQDTG